MPRAALNECSKYDPLETIGLLGAVKIAGRALRSWASTAGVATTSVATSSTTSGVTSFDTIVSSLSVGCEVSALAATSVICAYSPNAGNVTCETSLRVASLTITCSPLVT